MSDVEDFGEYQTAWCPGCGNFPLLKCIKKALANLDLRPHRLLFVSGIGQAAKSPHYLNANVFNGLHGRALPVATGAKLANPALTVIAESGDGCTYSEGGNHFIAAIRRNIDMTLIVHNNQIYGLTKGQASPTTEKGHVTRAQPMGVCLTPFNPLAVAITHYAGFVARSFVGLESHLVDVLEQAISHKGFSLVDVLQPCVSFNRINTFKWYRDRCEAIPDDHNPENREEAMRLADQWGDRIPIGIFYKNEAKSFEEYFPVLQKGPLVGRDVDRAALKSVMMDHR